MCLFAAIIWPDLGSISHTVSLFHIFSHKSGYGSFGSKTQLSRGNGREARKCACLSWRAWLGLPFDMLIYAILEQPCSRTHAAYILYPRSIFPLYFWTQFWLWVFEEVWVWVVKDSLSVFIWHFAVFCLFWRSEGSVRVSLEDIFVCPSRQKFGTGGPVLATNLSWLWQM